jgi:hypothetical protein
VTSFDDLSGPLPLPPEESLDDDEVGDDPDEGYSPGERPRALATWGTTEREELDGESLELRLGREEPELAGQLDGDGIGDTSDTDGEPIDAEVGDVRAGRLVRDDGDADDDLAIDVGIDAAAASAEEAAVHVVPDDDGAGASTEAADVRALPDDDEPVASLGALSAGGPVRGTGVLGTVSDTLDDLAAFLMQHAWADGVSEDERVRTFAVVDAYQEGDAPSQVEAEMRRLALRFADDPDYRAEWRPIS